ncbi:MAG: multicopper oxidase domain-containing protein [Acidobacteriota bacterium]
MSARRLMLLVAFGAAAVVAAASVPTPESAQVSRSASATAGLAVSTTASAGLFQELPVEGEFSRQRFREPPVAPKTGANQAVTLEASHIEIDDRLALAYNGAVPGPTIYMEAGKRSVIRLRNELKPLTEEQLVNYNPPVLRSDEAQILKDFLASESSVTNLHGHGLNVSPAGRSDNVMLQIQPGNEHAYIYRLRRDHPSGTFWYHAHLHGSTALQVQGGMAGPLIVRAPEGQSLNPSGYAVEESIVMVRFGGGGPIASGGASLIESRNAAVRRLLGVENPEDLEPRVRSLGADEVGKLMREMAADREIGPRLLVNGQLDPLKSVVAGGVQRLRIINAGSRRRDYKDIWIDGHDMYLAAFDGINLRQLPRDADGQYIAYTQESPLSLAPGNRADVFFVPSTEGEASLRMSGHVGLEDLGVDLKPMIRAGARSARVPFTQALMTFQIEGSKSRSLLSDSAKAALEADFVKALDANLIRLQRTDPYLNHLRPFTDPIEIERVMTFDIAAGKSGQVPPPIGARDRIFLINERDYNTVNEGEPLNHHTMQGMQDYLGREAQDGGIGPNGQTPWPMRANTEEMWKVVNASNAQHPFHIHVNPFWVHDIEEFQDGKLVSVRETNPFDPRLDRWQDTIDIPLNGGSVTLKHRLGDFVGLYVMHCHILQHEDRGMMMNILLVPNDENDPDAFFERQNAQNRKLNEAINGAGVRPSSHGHGHGHH